MFLNSITLNFFLGHYLDFVIKLYMCYCKTNRATCGSRGIYIFEDRIKIHKQHLLEWVSLLIFTDLTFFPGGRDGEGDGGGMGEN